jgi:hypothetical protein
MKKLLIAFACCLLACSTSALAQGLAITALRYSQTQFGGSARFQATGGAATALGGDISSAYYNPAGLGFNRKSEFSISPSLAIIGTEGQYMGNTMNDSKVNPNINHFGVAFAFPSDGKGDFKGGTFAITFTRINNFNENALYSGRNDRSSIADGLLYLANNYNQEKPLGERGITPAQVEDQFSNGIYDLEVLAINNYVVNPIRDNFDRATNRYYTDVNQGTFAQRETVRTTGSQNQWNISYGGNYKDLIYFGAGLGIQTFNYTSQTIFDESQLTVNPIRRLNKPDSVPPVFMNSLTLTENRTQKGTGFNLNLGLIARPIDFLRLGVSFTSPTWFALTTEYNANLATTYSNYIIDGIKLDRTITGDVLNGVSNLNMTTPLRLNMGIAGIIGKYGFLSFDAEYVNFRSMSVSADFNVDKDNQAINENYTSAFNYRGGGELRLSKLRLRAGGAYYGSPYKVNDQFFKGRLCITGGVGYYNKKNYFDLTLVQQTSGVSRTVYDLPGGSPIAGLTTSRTNLVFTAGFYF